MSLVQAVSVFFKTLFYADFRQSVQEMESNRIKLKESESLRQDLEARLKLLELKKPAEPALLENTDGAKALLSLLQKEARFLDFLNSEISGLSDEKVGSVVKVVHRDLRRIMQDFVVLGPVLEGREGHQIKLEQSFTVHEVQILGGRDVEVPFEGILRHRGWKVNKLNLPKMRQEQGDILMSAQVEVS